MFSLFVIQTLHVYRTKSLGRFLHIKFHCFVVFQPLVRAKIFDIVSVNEDIFTAFIRFNESKSFLGIEKFYFALL